MGSVLVLLVYALLLFPFTPGSGDLRKKKVQRPSVVVDARGHELVRFQRQTREWVPLNDISPHVVNALVATEDVRFYSHHGVDLRRVVTAAGWTVLGKPQGASTLNMQLARNLYPDKIGGAWLPNRKLKEIITAYKIEAAYEKDEILEAYLNSVPFLYNVHGIEMAARTYFDKPANDLNTLEAATLVGMLKATTYYNPRINPERAKWRRNVVLEQMVKHGSLEASEAERLKDKPIRLRFSRQTRSQSIVPHYTEHVRRTLEPWLKRNGYDLYTDGLTIHTPLDLRMQRMAEQAVRRQMNTLQAVADVEWSQRENPLRGHHPGAYVAHQRNVTPFAYFWSSQTNTVNAFIRETEQYRKLVATGVTSEDAVQQLRSDQGFMDALRVAKTRLETGFVALDPSNGHVRAWVGSRDYFRGPFDHVAKSRRQPGSTFKPFVYAAALEQGMTPDDAFMDAPVAIRVNREEVWRPVNAGSYSEEPMTLREGLARSKNSVAAQVMEEVGPRYASRTAQDMGVRYSKLDRVPSLVLGTSPVTLLEMAAAYGTIAGQGDYHEPVVVTAIEAHDGTVIEKFSSEPENAISEETALQVYDMLRDGVEYGTSQRIRTVFGINADVAGKTGTTQGNMDGWYLLMHPQLVAGAWVGFDDPRVTFRSDYWGQGAHNALYVVGDFYRTALRQGQLNPNNRIPDPTPPVPAWQFTDFAENSGSWAQDLLNRATERVGMWWASLQQKEAAEEDVPAALPAPRVAERRPERSRNRVVVDDQSQQRPARRGWRETDDERRDRIERAVREVIEERDWRAEVERKVQQYIDEYDGDVAAMLRDAERIRRDLQQEWQVLEQEFADAEREMRGW